MQNGIIKADTKSIIVAKSKFGLVNNIILESYLNRINTLLYDVNIIEDKDYYKIIITCKNSIGRA